MTCFTDSMFYRMLPVCLGIVLFAAGCGPSRPKTVPVTGVVTLDGKAVGGASVMLTPNGDGRPAMGMTDKEGKFSLKTFEPGDGAILGKHQLTVRKVEAVGVQADPDGLSGAASLGGIKEKWIIPKKYSNPKQWDHTVEVEAGMEPLKLELQSR
ncbi:MAG: carboxypeptidase-like regulatory domain-containing protein [Planctomycetota bacterium]|nr:carboxypeptidase-like regulatory domain-containing protein [Planctomycetota bacterium]